MNEYYKGRVDGLNCALQILQTRQELHKIELFHENDLKKIIEIMKNEILENYLKLNNIFKVTNSCYCSVIIADRYTGSYSGDVWTAWECNFQEIPEEIFAGDVECRDFWDSYEGNPLCGKGKTPDEAVFDLYKKQLERSLREE